MKKLMIAMSAAAMMSLCAQAAPQGGTPFNPWTGTDFENYDGAFDIEADDFGGDTYARYWAQRAAGVTGESALITTNSNTYLKVDETEELTRLIDVDQGAVAPKTVVGQSGSGIYFSSKVQFTAADDEPAVSEGVDKIIVWAKAPDEEPGGTTTTNLMVTALDLSGSFDDPQAEDYNENYGKPKAYDTGVTITADQWYTLDIVAEAQSGDSPIAFTVSLDGVSVGGTYNSMVTSGEASGTISSASFKGTGAVDDIDWGTVEVVAPIPLTVEAYNMSVSYTVDGGAATTYADGAAIPANAQTLTFTVTPDTGYIVTNAIAFVAGDPDPVEVPLQVVNNTLTIDVATYNLGEDAGITVAFVATSIGDKTLIASSDVTLSSASAEYSEGMSFPTVTVTVGGEPLEAGTDYSLSWNPALITQAATYTVRVEGKGNYYGTVEKTFTVTAAGGSYPSYIGDDTTKKGKYDTWKAAMVAAGVEVGDGEDYQDAYLLNCKPADVATEVAAFKFTKIAFEGGIWVTATTTKNTSGADYNGTVTVTRYSDVGCQNESETGTFFKATLE